MRRRLLGNYEIGRLLGEGSFGLVYEASPVGSDKRVALKQITKLGVRREEILQGKGGGHRRTVTVHDRSLTPLRWVGWFGQRDNLFELDDLLRRNAFVVGRMTRRGLVSGYSRSGQRGETRKSPGAGCCAEKHARAFVGLEAWLVWLLTSRRGKRFCMPTNHWHRANSTVYDTR